MKTSSPRPLHPRLRLLLAQKLQRRLLASHPRRTPSGQRGASVLLVLIIAFVLLLGTAALASRSFLGFIGSVFQVQGREAGAAAELGATWTLSRLNLEQNRTMLVASVGSTSNETTFAPPATRWAAGSITNNLCGNAQTPNTGTQATLLNPTTNTYTWFVTANGTVTATQPTGGNYRSFTILGVRRPAKDNLFIWKNRNFAELEPPSTTSSGTQPAALRIEGASFRNGVRVASRILEQELEVVPKCCRRSFGGAHGNDRYEEGFLQEGEAAVCAPPDVLGYGLLAGAGPGTGSVSLKGTPDFQFSSGDTIVDVDPIFCKVDESNLTTDDCAIQTAGNNVPTVSTIDGDVGLPNTFEEAAAKAGLSVGSALQDCQNQSPATCGDLFTYPTTADPAAPGTIPTDSFISLGTDSFTGTSGVRFVNAASIDLDPSSTDEPASGFYSSLPSYCFFENVPDPAGGGVARDKIHCKLNSLKPASGTPPKPIAFRTSRQRELILYFPNENTGSGGNASVIDVNGSGYIANYNCTPTGGTFPQTSGTSGCVIPQLDDNPPYPITTLSLLGCTTSGCGPQTLAFNGTPNSVFIWIWFPYGSMNYVGTSDFTGVAWVENLNVNGTPTFTIPGSGLGDILCQTNVIKCANNPNPTENPPFFDWLARATNRFRWIGN